MFELSFTKRDAVRAGYAFLFAVLAFVAVAQPKSGSEWKAVVVGAIAAGLSAAKNALLRDGSLAKG